MSISKEPYIPSPFTLTQLDNFGTRRLIQQPQTNHAANPHMSHHRNEARMRPALDKESLLEQLQKEKMKNRQINASSSFLKRQLSHSKHISMTSAAPPLHRSIDVSLKRQLEAMIQKIQAQAQQIGRIKASKKYNRYLELLTAKHVYEEQLKAAAKRTTLNNSALRQRKRMWRQHRQREYDTEAMDKAVKDKLLQENRTLAERVREQELKIKENLEGKALQLKQRDRLVRDIMHLQKLTGKIILVQKEENSKQNQEQSGLAAPPKIFQRQVQEPPKQDDYYDQFQQDSASQRDSSSSQSSDTSKENTNIPAGIVRRHNASF